MPIRAVSARLYAVLWMAYVRMFCLWHALYHNPLAIFKRKDLHNPTKIRKSLHNPTKCLQFITKCLRFMVYCRRATHHSKTIKEDKDCCVRMFVDFVFQVPSSVRRHPIRAGTARHRRADRKARRRAGQGHSQQLQRYHCKRAVQKCH